MEWAGKGEGVDLRVEGGGDGWADSWGGRPLTSQHGHMSMREL